MWVLRRKNKCATIKKTIVIYNDIHDSYLTYVTATYFMLGKKFVIP